MNKRQIKNLQNPFQIRIFLRLTQKNLMIQVLTNFFLKSSQKIFNSAQKTKSYFLIDNYSRCVIDYFVTNYGPLLPIITEKKMTL